MKEGRDFQSRRSFIFTPGTRPELLSKAFESGADIVCLELEDGVAPDEKNKARQNVVKLFKSAPVRESCELVVRVNSLRTRFGLDDLVAFLDTPPPLTIMLPKVESEDEVKIIDDLFLESNQQINLQIIIETNKGLEACFEIAQSSPNITALFFGGVDMAADLRCSGTWDSLLYARSKLVHAAAAANIDSLDVPFLDLNDENGLLEQATLAKELGFSGKGAIHPKQIPVINSIFTPSPEEIAYAVRVIEEFKKAESGLVVIDGKLIEKPVLREMERKLTFINQES
tara:strand:+ start:15252 stop:16106 length:855 start_codon:yes stop_codon:yes gene_type:complete